MPARHLPARPDLRQLRNQAKELLRDMRSGDPAAIADFREYHPELADAASAKLADAQLVLARSYGFSNWPRLAAACELIAAVRHEDLEAVRDIALAYTELADEYARAAPDGWRAAMSQAANHGLQLIVDMFRKRRTTDIQAIAANPESRAWVDAMRALGQLGGSFPVHAIGGSVESLSGSNFAFMVELGTGMEDETGSWRSRFALALETYARNPAGKHQILETMAAHGVPIPDTPAMAVHRGRIDLLEEWLRRDPHLLERTFSHEEIFPPELGCHSAASSLALVGAPLGGATLLHMAADYEELEVVRWLLDRGMDVNARAAIDAQGFGGYSALFSCVVTYNAGRPDEPIARLLLQSGVDTGIRGSLRKRLPFARDKSEHEYRDVTAYEWGQRFHDQSYVSRNAMRLIAEGGNMR